MSNGNYVKWEKCQMGKMLNGKCQMGMSYGNVKWEFQLGKYQMENVEWEMLNGKMQNLE